MTTKKPQEESAPSSEKLTITRSELNGLIDQEMAKLIKKERAKIKKEVEKEHAARVSVPTYSANLVEKYLQVSGLTDKKFVKTLLQYHVSAEEASVLRDEHITKSRSQIWELIRANYNPAKK